MVSNSNFQCVQSSNSSNLQSSNSQTLKLSNVKYSNPTSLKLSNSLGLKAFKLQALKLSNSSLRALGLLCEPLRVLQRSFTLLPRATRCRGFKLPSRIPIQTFKLQTRALSNSKLSIFQISTPSFSKLFKISNSPISSNI